MWPYLSAKCAMNEALVLLCSPRVGGVTDTAARCFVQGLTDVGMSAQVLALRDYAVFPCTGCGACASPPHACLLADNDDADYLLHACAAAPLLFFASPIYFYHLPAHFKAFMDRAQRFWEQEQYVEQDHRGAAQVRPALALLTAGRPRGAQLFTGALLSLKYFLQAFHVVLRETHQWYGMESVENLTTDRREAMYARGQAWARACLL